MISGNFVHRAEVAEDFGHENLCSHKGLPAWCRGALSRVDIDTTTSKYVTSGLRSLILRRSCTFD